MLGSKSLTKKLVRKPRIAIREFPGSFASPWLMKLDDNQDYLIKFAFEKKDNSLINEWICGNIAKKLNLPVVDLDIVDIDLDFINASTELVTRLVKPGKHFATAFVNGSTNLNSEIAKGIEFTKIENANKIPGMIVFDIFVNNTDRSQANSLIAPVDEARQKFKYFLIDQGHCLGGPSWTQTSLETLPFATNNIPWNMEGITGIESFLDTIEQLKGIETKDYQEMVDTMPNEWNPNGIDLSKLIEVLVKRDKDRINTVLEEMNRNDNNRFRNWVIS